MRRWSVRYIPGSSPATWLSQARQPDTFDSVETEVVTCDSRCCKAFSRFFSRLHSHEAEEGKARIDFNLVYGWQTANEAESMFG